MEKYIASELTKKGIKISEYTVIGYKNGLFNPSYKSAIAICEILGIDIEELRDKGFPEVYNQKRDEIKVLKQKEQQMARNEVKKIGNKLKIKKVRNYKYLIEKSKLKGAN